MLFWVWEDKSSETTFYFQKTDTGALYNQTHQIHKLLTGAEELFELNI